VAIAPRGAPASLFERGELTQRRLISHKRRDKLGSLPIAVASEVIDLLHQTCVDIVLATIWEAEQRFAATSGS
jgi:hypothetical protein